MTTDPRLADAFADALRRFREAAGDMEEILESPGLAAVRREARVWRRHVDLALGTEHHVTADETAAALAAMSAQVAT
jgi:hypothetical protein